MQLGRSRVVAGQLQNSTCILRHKANGTSTLEPKGEQLVTLADFH